MHLKAIITAAVFSLAAATTADQLREGPPHIGGNHIAPVHAYKSEPGKHHKARAEDDHAYPYSHPNVDKHHDPAKGGKYFPSDSKEAWQSFKNGVKPSHFNQDDDYPKVGMDQGKPLSRSKHQERDAMASVPFQALNDGAKGVKNSEQRTKVAAEAKGKHWARGATQDFGSFKHGDKVDGEDAKIGWGGKATESGRGK